jgi:hypothetical protein
MKQGELYDYSIGNVLTGTYITNVQDFVRKQQYKLIANPSWDEVLCFCRSTQGGRTFAGAIFGNILDHVNFKK